MTKHWTDQNIDDLMYLVEEMKLPWQEVADSLKRTPGACRSMYGQVLRDMAKEEAS